MLYENNCFITLTYSDEHLPHTSEGIPTLRPSDFTNFMKRLRKTGRKPRYFQAGEYGELGRPHHHALLFNCCFPDRIVWRKDGDFTLYRSEELERLWPFGYSEIGTVTPQSAGYIAKYTLKEEQNLNGREPEYHTMSRNPGLGKKFLQKYITDVYPRDQVILSDNAKIKPPRYYDSILEKEQPAILKRIKARRKHSIHPDVASGKHRQAREDNIRARALNKRRKI